MNFETIASASKRFLANNEATIRTVTTSLLILSTTYLAFDGGHRAESALIDLSRQGKEPTNRRERFRVTWRYYAPATAGAIFSIGLILSTHQMNGKKQAAFAAAYSAAQRTLSDYKKEVVNLIGEKKEAQVSDNLAAKQVSTNDSSQAQVIITGNGEQLCFETLTSRYFKSSAEQIRRAENTINHRILHDGYASLNDFYQEIGLPTSNLGDDLGWDSTKLLDLRLSSHLTSEDVPALAISFKDAPVPNYWRVG